MTLPSTSLSSQKPKKQHIQKVLLVEDSFVRTLNLKTVLETEDLIVEVVSDGAEVIEQAQKQKFDLIVLPRLNGYETCRRLKNYPATANIPIILFTNGDCPIDALTGLKLGIIDYIPKDAFAQAMLLNTIRRLNKKVFDEK